MLSNLGAPPSKTEVSRYSTDPVSVGPDSRNGTYKLDIQNEDLNDHVLSAGAVVE